MKYFIYIFLLFLGFAIGKYVSIPNFEVDKSINLVDVAGLLVTIGAAYWISKVIDKENQEHRTEKELFLKRSEGIAENVRDFSIRTSNGTINLIEVTSTCKRINIAIESLYQALSASKYNCDPIAKSYLILSVNNIKTLLTTTPIQNSLLPNPGIQIANGMITVTGALLNSIETEFENLKNRFLQFQIEINRL